MIFLRRWVPGLLATAAVLLGSSMQAAHYKLFVLTGQSNSLGTTAGGESDPTSGSDPGDPHVHFYWHNIANATTSLGDSGGAFVGLQDQQGGFYSGSATHWGPEMEFGRTLYRAGVREFGIIKASRGGGGNSYWLKTNPDHHMYTHVVDTVTAAASALTNLGHTFEIVGLLYLQGESDSSGEAAVAGTRLKTLVDNLRVDLPQAASLHCVIGGIAAAGSTRDVVRANQQAIAGSTAYIDYFSNLDLQPNLYDSLHFDKAAKITIGERYAQAFFDAGVVSRHYGKLVFVGDSITQGGNGRPSYRYTVFQHLANRGVPINPAAGYQFAGSQTGAYQNNAGATPNVNGQVFANIHDGHWGWRASWVSARVALPGGRYNINNLGAGTLLNWTGQSSTYNTADAGTLPYTGATYTPDTVSIMIGINDVADGTTAAQVRDDLGTLIDQLRASNPNVSIFLNKVLHTNQGASRDAQVDALNALLPALVDAKNVASTNSAVWLVDADTGFNPVTQTYDNIHPNASGETYVGDRIAARLGLLVTPAPPSAAAPPHIEAGSAAFPSSFEGNEIWNGAAYINGWGEWSAMAESLPQPTDLRLVHAGSGGDWIHGTASGWTAGNQGSWTFETRLKFSANPSGFILWLGTDTKRILVEIHGNRTQDYGGSDFNVAHNNLDGQFHVFRVAHDAANGRYHVWRDATRLTPLDGATYDQSSADDRLILGDYTSGSFGDNFDVTIDHVRYDQTGAYLPPGADADADGLPDSWEYQYYGDIIAGEANADDDHDEHTTLEEYIANTHPGDSNSVFRLNSIAPLGASLIEVAMPTSAQRNYSLWKLPMMGATNWTQVDGPTMGTDGILVLQDAFATAPWGVYRASVAIP